MSMITVHKIVCSQAFVALCGNHAMHWLHDEDHGIIAGPVCECGWSTDQPTTPDEVAHAAITHGQDVLTATVAARQTRSETAP
jgi:hypothetical protein